MAVLSSKVLKNSLIHDFFKTKKHDFVTCLTANALLNRLDVFGDF